MYEGFWILGTNDNVKVGFLQPLYEDTVGFTSGKVKGRPKRNSWLSFFNPSVGSNTVPKVQPSWNGDYRDSSVPVKLVTAGNQHEYQDRQPRWFDEYVQCHFPYLHFWKGYEQIYTETHSNNVISCHKQVKPNHRFAQPWFAGEYRTFSFVVRCKLGALVQGLKTTNHSKPSPEAWHKRGWKYRREALQ